MSRQALDLRLRVVIWVSLVLCGLVGLLAVAGSAWAEARPRAQAQAQKQVTGTATTAPTAPAATPSPTPASLVSPTATPSPTPAVTQPVAAPPAGDTAIGPAAIAPPLADSAILSGTIIANRTPVTVTFFLEGRLYSIKRLRSFAIRLPRPAAVLSLYNCEGDALAPAEDCFWDPYLIRQDGFYEVYNGAALNQPVQLRLQEASAPPMDQVWVHNRTGREQRVYYGGQETILAPAAVQEIAITSQEDPVFFLSSCVVLGQDAACEWLPQKVKGGIYYALVEVVTPGGLPDSAVRAAVLQPIVANVPSLAMASAAAPLGAVAAPAADAAAPIAAPAAAPSVARLTCRLQVPTLNVRSGPGLQYLILSTLERPQQGQRSVTVVGRDPRGDWLAVDPRTVAGGWIIASERFVVCEGEIAALPVAEVTDGRLAPTVTPAPQAARPAAAAGEPPPTATPAPSNKAILIVQNVYDDEVTFTISPIVEERLRPGQSIQLELEPGRITFSVGTPRGYSGNAEMTLGAGDTRQLFLHFEPETIGSEVFVLKY